MSKKYKVYYHKDKIYNKYYIGITSRPLDVRFGKDGYNYFTQYFGHIIKTIGWENFEHGVLFDNLSESEAKQKEVEMIQKYNSLFPNGYNYTKGGDTMPNDIICIETNEIINNDEEDIQKYLDNNYNIFHGKIKPIDIIDCCKRYIKKIKAFHKDEYYHFIYIKNCGWTIEDMDDYDKAFDYVRKSRSKKKEDWCGDFKRNGIMYTRCVCRKCGEQFTKLKNGEENCNRNICKRCFLRYKCSCFIY